LNGRFSDKLTAIRTATTVEFETRQVGTYHLVMTNIVHKTRDQHDLTKLASAADSWGFEAATVLIAQSHALDAQDVQEGRMTADQLGFFSRQFVKSLKLHFPEDRASSRSHLTHCFMLICWG
jgi:hypothetical protein